MTGDELADLCRDLRAAQRRYFRERTAEALHASKELEHRLDRVLAAWGKPAAPTLFDAGNGEG